MEKSEQGRRRDRKGELSHRKKINFDSVVKSKSLSMFDRWNRKFESKARLLECCYHLTNIRVCLTGVRRGDVSIVLALMEGSMDGLVVMIEREMQNADPPIKNLAIEGLKRTYEYRQEYEGAFEPLTLAAGTERAKQQAAERAEANKLLLHIWKNEPGDPRYRQAGKNP